MASRTDGDVVSDSGYDPAEVALVRALCRDFGEEAFNATLREHPDAMPFPGGDGIFRIRLGAVELWLDELGRTCYGVQVGPDLRTGLVEDGEFHLDAPFRLWDPEDN